MNARPAPPSSNARAVLAVLWLAAFVAALAIPFVLYSRGGIEMDGLQPSLAGLSGIYAPHVGAILAYYLATRKLPARGAMTRGAFLLAVSVSGLWNLAVLAIILPTLWGGAGLVESTRTAASLGSQLAWVVGPVLGYFFAKASD